MRFKPRIAFVGLLLLFCFDLSGRAADLSIIFTGAPRYCLLGDINRGTNGYLDFWGDLARASGDQVAEDKNPLHFLLSYSVDLVLALDPEYSLVVGAGRFRISGQSEIFVTSSVGAPDATARVETTLEAIPIKLSAIRRYHLARNLDTFLEGGLTINIAKYRSSYWPAGPGDSHLQNAHALGIGLLCAAGLEIRPIQHFALILRAQGDYAKISGFKGTRESGGSNPTYEVEGTLYYEELIHYSPPGVERIHPLLLIFEDKPSTALRKARVDLSGVSLSAGLRISF